MKKTQRKDAVRNIRKRIASYLSVCLVIVLGIGGMLTTRYTEAGLDSTASEFYKDLKFKDFELISSLGVSDASIHKLNESNDVVDAEGVLQMDGSAAFGEGKANITLLSMTKKVSIPDVIEGRAPLAADECIIGEDFAETSNLKVGDKLRISVTGKGMSSADALSEDALFDEGETAEEDSSPLVKNEFTVTGLMRHPDYLRRLSVNTVAVQAEAFNNDVTKGLYTKVCVRINQPDGISPFSDEYFEETEDSKELLEKLAKELEAYRAKEVKDEAYARIDSEWSKAKEKLEEAQAQIDSGEAELNSRLADGRKKLDDAQNELNKKSKDGEKQIKEAETKLKKVKKYCEYLDKSLPGIKNGLAEKRKKYEDDLAQLNAQIKSLEELISDLEDWDSDPEKTELILKILDTLAKKVADICDDIEAIQEFFDSDIVKQIIERIKEVSEGKIDLSGLVKNIKGIDVSKLRKIASDITNLADKIRNREVTVEEARRSIESLKQRIGSLDDLKKELDKTEKYIALYEKNKTSYIARAEKKLKKYKDFLKKEKKKYQDKIDEGWNQYNSLKSEYESKLAEAIELLAENKALAEEKLAEAKAEVDAISCEWILLDRRGNEGYVDLKTNLLSIKSMGLVFGLLFSIITAIVCFSTLVIMIDEQKTLVGTCKAFGFHKKEVLGKYLVFGLSSAVVGSILAAVAAYILTRTIQSKLADTGMYSFGEAKSVVVPGATLLAALFISAVTVAATVFACSDILKSPASLLMNGGVLKKKSTRPIRKKSAKGGSLYSRLIIRNILDDKARVMVSIAVIAFSCLLIGLGVSMKGAFDGMVVRQTDDVNRYDIRIDMNDEVTDDEKAGIVDVLRKNGLDYLPASVESRLYVWDGKIDGLQMICADPSEISGFYGISDPNTGNDLTLPDDGVLIQKRMHESYKMNTGDMLPVLGSDFSTTEVEVKGYFMNYAGRAVVLSPEAYKKAFGKEPVNMSFFVKTGAKDRAGIESQLLAVTDKIVIEADDEFKTKFESAMNLYNLLVIVVTLIAIFISFMILTNLANIYMAKKKTELSIMRVNGFSIKQTKAYLVRESILTSIAGIVLGVLVGAIITPILIQSMQLPDLEFIKTFQPRAWIVAAGLEATFAILINYVVFRKVKDLNLRDIAG